MSCNIQVVTLQIAQTNLEFWELDGLLQKPEVRSSLMTLYYRREDKGDKPVCPVLTPVIDLIFHLNPGFSLGALRTPARRIVNPIMTDGS